MTNSLNGILVIRSFRLHPFGRLFLPCLLVNVWELGIIYRLYFRILGWVMAFNSSCKGKSLCYILLAWRLSMRRNWVFRPISALGYFSETPRGCPISGVIIACYPTGPKTYYNLLYREVTFIIFYSRQALKPLEDDKDGWPHRSQRMLVAEGFS